MSNAPAQQTISLAQIDGRIAELEAQRNEAQTRAARIAGERAEAIELVRILKAEVDRLEAVVKRQSVLIPEQVDQAGAEGAGPAGQN